MPGVAAGGSGSGSGVGPGVGSGGTSGAGAGDGTTVGAAGAIGICSAGSVAVIAAGAAAVSSVGVGVGSEVSTSTRGPAEAVSGAGARVVPGAVRADCALTRARNSSSWRSNVLTRPRSCALRMSEMTGSANSASETAIARSATQPSISAIPQHDAERREAWPPPLHLSNPRLATHPLELGAARRGLARRNHASIE